MLERVFDIRDFTILFKIDSFPLQRIRITGVQYAEKDRFRRADRR
jgi:hypothetical protein